MLFAHTYVPHAMEKMIHRLPIFRGVVQRPGNGDFHLELFDGNAELKELMEVFITAKRRVTSFTVMWSVSTPCLRH